MRLFRALQVVSFMLLAAPAAAQTVAPAARPTVAKPEDQRAAFAAMLCSDISARAVQNGLPLAFLGRLIWKESMFNPQAESPVGAQGIAQFMPGTAQLRGLENPFEPRSALAASAAYLAELRDTFGNLGLAAAAYNAGEQRVRDWLAGEGGLPFETQDYVYAITGRTHDEWKKPGVSYPIPTIGSGGTFSEQCLRLALRQPEARYQVASLTTGALPMSEPRAKPRAWNVIIAGGFSQARAMSAFRTLKKRYPSVLGGELPVVSRKRNLSMGRARMVRIAIGRDSRDEAQALCARLTALGGACLVEKN